jgi:hypothetical protein
MPLLSTKTSFVAAMKSTVVQIGSNKISAQRLISKRLPIGVSVTAETTVLAAPALEGHAYQQARRQKENARRPLRPIEMELFHTFLWAMFMNRECFLSLRERIPNGIYVKRRNLQKLWAILPARIKASSSFVGSEKL